MAPGRPRTSRRTFCRNRLSEPFVGISCRTWTSSPLLRQELPTRGFDKSEDGHAQASPTASARDWIPGTVKLGESSSKAGGFPIALNRRSAADSIFLILEWNVRDSDGTVVFSIERRLTGGSKKTVEFAQNHGKPCLHLSARADGDKAAERLRPRDPGTHGISQLSHWESLRWLPALLYE